jgi:hypothetical protein
MKNRIALTTLVVPALVAAACAGSDVPPAREAASPNTLTQRGVEVNNRDIQIVKVDLAARILQVQNLGTETVPLDRWRFCSHDDAVFRRYSGANGLNGRSLAAGESLFLFFNNNAPVRPNAVNISALGGQFASLDNGPFAISLYFPDATNVVNFADGNFQADHIQWSIGGLSDPSADERSDEAVAGGTWTAIDAWVATSSNSQWIVLNDLSGAELHGPANYLVYSCIADLNNTTNLDFFDISLFLNAFSSGQPLADINLDGLLDFFDVSAYLALFSAGCP